MLQLFTSACAWVWERIDRFPGTNTALFMDLTASVAPGQAEEGINQGGNKGMTEEDSAIANLHLLHHHHHKSVLLLLLLPLSLQQSLITLLRPLQ